MEEMKTNFRKENYLIHIEKSRYKFCTFNSSLNFMFVCFRSEQILKSRTNFLFQIEAKSTKFTHRFLCVYGIGVLITYVKLFLMPNRLRFHSVLKILMVQIT